MKHLTCLVAIASIFFTCKDQSFPLLKGSYMGQSLPGRTAELFAPGIVSNELCNRDVAMSPDGKEMCFGVHTPDFAYATIIGSREVNGVWTRPEVLPFAADPRYVYLEPCFSANGQKLFFMANLPKNGTENPAEEDIWFVERTEDGWSDPLNAGPNVNTDGHEFYPSLTADGTLYFTRADVGARIHYIYRCRWVDGAFAEAERLPEQINCGVNRYNAFIAPDESFCVVPAVGMPDSYGGTDYYITFRNADDTWTDPVNMGPQFNHATGGEWSFSMSPDQKVIFFMATQNTVPVPETLTYDFFFQAGNGLGNGNPDIYWIDAGILDSLRE